MKEESKNSLVELMKPYMYEIIRLQIKIESLKNKLKQK